jgi:hypothetical protein
MLLWLNPPQHNSQNAYDTDLQRTCLELYVYDFSRTLIPRLQRSNLHGRWGEAPHLLFIVRNKSYSMFLAHDPRSAINSRRSLTTERGHRSPVEQEAPDSTQPGLEVSSSDAHGASC